MSFSLSSVDSLGAIPNLTESSVMNSNRIKIKFSILTQLVQFIGEPDIELDRQVYSQSQKLLDVIL